jgi:hypothetical protein
MTTIEEKIVDLKLAENVYSARHIVEGLHLEQLTSVEKQLERVRLYRRHRPLGSNSKIKTIDAYREAIAGREPMTLF